MTMERRLSEVFDTLRWVPFGVNVTGQVMDGKNRAARSYRKKSVIRFPVKIESGQCRCNGVDGRSSGMLQNAAPSYESGQKSGCIPFTTFLMRGFRRFRRVWVEKRIRKIAIVGGFRFDESSAYFVCEPADAGHWCEERKSVDDARFHV